MSERFRGGILRSVGLSLWAMATLVLVFLVLLLAAEMAREGRDPRTLLRAAQTADSPESEERRPRPAETTGTREITLFFARGDGQGLAAESRRIEVTASTAENCRRALNELIKGPGRAHLPIFPSEVNVRALYLLEDGELVIDFSREVLPMRTPERSAMLEALLVYGVVNTLTQPELHGTQGAGVHRVRLLIEGAPPQDGASGHLDLAGPLGPAMHWVADRAGRSADG